VSSGSRGHPNEGKGLREHLEGRRRVVVEENCA
jgi:hypothetical protein